MSFYKPLKMMRNGISRVMTLVLDLTEGKQYSCNGVTRTSGYKPLVILTDNISVKGFRYFLTLVYDTPMDTLKWATTMSGHPDLSSEELDKLTQLFLTEIADDRANARKWRARLHDLTRAVYKSRKSLAETMEVSTQAAQAKPKQAGNPWLERASYTTNSATEDVEMNGKKQDSTFRFLRSSYPQNEIGDLRRLCETRYGFPSRLRQPTDNEWKIVKGILEGTILCMERLPDFLKRVCTNAALRVIQNTIKAQVEGDLMLLLSPDFKVFPEFQSRRRLTSEFFLGIKNSGNNPAKVATMLQEAKQICYDQGHHTVHLIFWTREMAAKWGKEFGTLTFRNRRFPLQNAHQEDASLPEDNTQRATRMWARFACF
ncbi:hypothetical protein ON010_g3708 [Phytophthora cinnamomi]|nr:hypothetical protein ON010_g3708 [Phytophthora cinnamomi]